MKKIILLFVVIGAMSFTTSTQTAEVNWQDFNAGFLKANQNQKIALIDAYTDWCGWCKRMDKTTYSSTEVVDKINEHFVPIKFNPELKKQYYVGNDTLSGPQLLAALSENKHTGYPTTYFYIPGKKRIYQYPGYMDAKSFIKVLDEMIKEANK
jgi:thioredoxin-related protein